MHVRLSQILSTVFIVLTYSSSIPVLYFIAFLTFVLMYWIDKHLIFTYYKKDKDFDEKLLDTVLDIMPIAIAIHLFFAIFMFSSQNILYSQSQDSLKYGLNSQYLNKFWTA